MSVVPVVEAWDPVSCFWIILLGEIRAAGPLCLAVLFVPSPALPSFSPPSSSCKALPRGLWAAESLPPAFLTVTLALLVTHVEIGALHLIFLTV